MIRSGFSVQLSLERHCSCDKELTTNYLTPTDSVNIRMPGAQCLYEIKLAHILSNAYSDPVRNSTIGTDDGGTACVL